jgi:hypothetical protein
MGGCGSYGYTYHNDGNRLTQVLGGVTTGYGYGTGNDLLATTSVGGITTQTIGYTADGRMSSLSPGIQAPGGQFITSLSYNQNARLSAVDSSNGALASYTYDGFGQRLLKTVSASYGEIYQYGQDGMLLEETNSSGVAQADYIYHSSTFDNHTSFELTNQRGVAMRVDSLGVVCALLLSGMRSKFILTVPDARLIESGCVVISSLFSPLRTSCDQGCAPHEPLLGASGARKEWERSPIALPASGIEPCLLIESGFRFSRGANHRFWEIFQY